MTETASKTPRSAQTGVRKFLTNAITRRIPEGVPLHKEVLQSAVIEAVDETETHFDVAFEATEG